MHAVAQIGKREGVKNLNNYSKPSDFNCIKVVVLIVEKRIALSAYTRIRKRLKIKIRNKANNMTHFRFNRKHLCQLT